jgi:hypothetical protein
MSLALICMSSAKALHHGGKFDQVVAPSAFPIQILFEAFR